MKFVTALILTVMWAATVSGDSKTCVVNKGRVMTTFGGNKINLDVPCKYNMINSRCGQYVVTLTPGGKYIYPQYMIDTFWLNVNDTSGNLLWNGRGTNRKAALYIIKENEPLTKKNGSMATDALFNISHDGFSAVVETKNGDFRITFSPFDFNGNRHKDSRLEFVCNADMDNATFPTQYCGVQDGQAFLEYVEDTFGTKKKKEEIVLYDIFHDSAGISQTDIDCKLATTALSAAVNETMRKEAIVQCRRILDTQTPRECALKYACSPIAVFRACVQFVVSNYTNDDACAELGAAIDLCRGYDNLVPKIQEKECYTDLLTSADNPHYGEVLPY